VEVGFVTQSVTGCRDLGQGLARAVRGRQQDGDEPVVDHVVGAQVSGPPHRLEARLGIAEIGVEERDLAPRIGIVRVEDHGSREFFESLLVLEAIEVIRG
jgi:hypothetical protein